ncbi:MAG: phasin family protein [Cystobacterineae bacterium]|nr:phasin family protein [Cystobacterineae bacterium]
MREIGSVFKMFLDAGEQQITRLAGQLMSNEAFMSALQGAIGKAMDAKLALDTQVRAALARLGVSRQEEIESLYSEISILKEEVQRLGQQIEQLRAEGVALATPLPRKPSLALAPEQPEKRYSEISAG